MLRGTSILLGEEAREFSRIVQSLRSTAVEAGFEEIMVPAIWDTKTFTDKLGAEKQGQMWTFQDKGGRDCCLVPEVTGIIQELWNDRFFRGRKLPVRLFYGARCYRYERPQAGRYRNLLNSAWKTSAAIRGRQAKKRGPCSRHA